MLGDLAPSAASHRIAEARPESTLNTGNQSSSAEFHRRSLGQKKRREREASENHKPEPSASSSARRSAAQQARRQRELATKIQHHLSTRGQSNDRSARSEAQPLRRKVEAAERRLDTAPDCDSTQALEKILSQLNRFCIFEFIPSKKPKFWRTQRDSKTAARDKKMGNNVNLKFDRDGEKVVLHFLKDNDGDFKELANLSPGPRVLGASTSGL
ncbi:hypothetical protein K438DRAFT_1929697 [Mycena galopus ATCC 62051]|nr:hypothetical protein K438DRAFT_1929697 [Mycena galopus ATCC 62051]